MKGRIWSGWCIGGVKPCHFKAFPELDIGSPSISPALCLSLLALPAAVSGFSKEKQSAWREPGGASSAGMEAVTLDLPTLHTRYRNVWCKADCWGIGSSSLIIIRVWHLLCVELPLSRCNWCTFEWQYNGSLHLSRDKEVFLRNGFLLKADQDFY